MSRRTGPRCAPVALACAVLSLVLPAGCQPVREDRTVNFSPQGDAVSFQHGQEGVFVAGSDGSGLQKIFQPGADTLATSPPLWHTDGRLIFTTARPPKNEPLSGTGILGVGDPAGQIHTQRPVVYTCWLRGAVKDGQAPAPVPLFEAACDHVGYVAANLAVRWHPKGDRILYIDRAGAHQHGLFAYDLATKTSSRVFPHSADALLFDWAPDREHLVCVLGSHTPGGVEDGVWVGSLDKADWWHVPQSAALAQGQLPSLLEQLRATQPAWTADSSRFAFVSYTPPPGKDKPGRHVLHVATLAGHQVEAVAEGPEPFRDMHWAPAGQRLGLLQGSETASLRVLETGHPLSQPLTPQPVRRFAGWDAGGKHLAYVTPDKLPLAAQEWWAFLLVPDPLARDAVYLADGKGQGAGREVFSGMRVTFPHWSPTENKLSLWVTFSPTHRSWISKLLNLGLHPGDPAAVLDGDTGRMNWLAVNAQEKAQVGHYHLLKREYAEAWRWYEQAEKEGQPAAPASLANFEAFLGSHDFTFFEYYCLTKLGRQEQARQKLDQFRGQFLRLPTKKEEPLLDTQVGDEKLEQILQKLLEPKGVCGALLRDLYVAEVFLSLDAAADGEQFFRQSLAAADTDGARFSSAVVLAQFLLLQQKHQEYADLATGTLVPLFLKMPRPPALDRGLERANAETLQELVTFYAGGAALLPLCSPDFLAGLREEQVRALLPRWRALEAQAHDDTGKLIVDLAWYAGCTRLRLEKERQEIAERLRKNPSVSQLPGEGDATRRIEEYGKSLRALAATP